MIGGEDKRGTTMLSSYISETLNGDILDDSASKEMIAAERARADRYMDMMDQLRSNYFKDLMNVRGYAENLEN